jgi:hypothetical protein
MTILMVPAGWLLALKLNYCISGNKYKGSDDGEPIPRNSKLWKVVGRFTKEKW